MDQAPKRSTTVSEICYNMLSFHMNIPYAGMLDTGPNWYPVNSLEHKTMLFSLHSNFLLLLWGLELNLEKFLANLIPYLNTGKTVQLLHNFIQGWRCSTRVCMSVCLYVHACVYCLLKGRSASFICEPNKVFYSIWKHLFVDSDNTLVTIHYVYINSCFKQIFIKIWLVYFFFKWHILTKKKRSILLLQASFHIG